MYMQREPQRCLKDCEAWIAKVDYGLKITMGRSTFLLLSVVLSGIDEDYRRETIGNVKASIWKEWRFLWGNYGHSTIYKWHISPKHLENGVLLLLGWMVGPDGLLWGSALFLFKAHSLTLGCVYALWIECVLLLFFYSIYIAPRPDL